MGPNARAVSGSGADGKLYQGMEVTSGQTKHTPVYCTVVGNSDLVPLTVIQLDDLLFRQSHGKIPVHAVLACPKCGQELQVQGDEFEIEVDYFSTPREIKVPVPNMETGEWSMQRRFQRANVSIHGVRACSGDAPNGKGICGFQFVLTDNVLQALR